MGKIKKEKRGGKRKGAGRKPTCKKIMKVKSKTEAMVLAKKFHEIYERLAPEFGYETRKETREFNSESPNGKLMIAVCSELLQLLSEEKETNLLKELIGMLDFLEANYMGNTNRERAEGYLKNTSRIGNFEEEKEKQTES